MSNQKLCGGNEPPARPQTDPKYAATPAAHPAGAPYQPHSQLRRFFFAALVGALLASAAIASPAITLIEDGTARTAIYVAPQVMEENHKVQGQPHSVGVQETERQRLRDSVTDLAACLEKMTETHVEVLTHEPASGDTRLPILIGSYAETIFGPCTQKSDDRQGWRMVVSGKGIGLIGESHEAVSYAIYEVLDRLGCRWFLPGELGEDMPQLKTIRLEETDLSAVPPLMTRFLGLPDPVFKRRIRAGGVPIQFNNLAVSIESYVPRKQLEAHPGWNAEIDGKRQVNGWLCLSNPEVVAAVADAVIAKLDAEYTPTISLSEGYTPRFCECAKCKALDAGDREPVLDLPSMTDRYVHFCNQVAERVTKKHPHVLFGMIANMECVRPPVREKLNPNLLPVVVPIIYCRAHALNDPSCPSRQQARAVVEGWAKLTTRFGFYEFGYSLAELTAPYPMLKLKEDLPFLFAHNVKMWMPYGWVADVMPTWEATLPGAYLGMRMAWNPKAKPEDILAEFYARFYGAAAEPMRRYWQIMDDAWQKTPEHAGCQYGYDRRFSPAVLASARAAINDALAVGHTTQEHARVQLANESLLRFELHMKLRRDLCAGQLANLDLDRERWESLSKELTKRYSTNFAFSSYTGPLDPAYKDGARIAQEFTLIQPPLRQWRYQIDREKKGTELGWSRLEFDDKDWKITDACTDTWADLGLYGYFGAVWYRAHVRLPSFPAGKTIHLWVSGMDGTCRLFVNGAAVPYVNAKNQTEPGVKGYRTPFSFDITSAVKPGADNQITIRAMRPDFNELGTGGLLGPVMLYREK